MGNDTLGKQGALSLSSAHRISVQCALSWLSWCHSPPCLCAVFVFGVHACASNLLPGCWHWGRVELRTHATRWYSPSNAHVLKTEESLFLPLFYFVSFCPTLSVCPSLSLSCPSLCILWGRTDVLSFVVPCGRYHAKLWPTCEANFQCGRPSAYPLILALDCCADCV